jgi:class 3 adenylate cyclase/predicted ATPase
MAVWLDQTGLPEYAPLFAEHAIDRAVLADLDDQDLRELGVPLGHRKRLLKAIAALREPPDETAGRGEVGNSTAPPRDAERRQLTVMFVDLVGSTALSAKLDPEEMRDVLRAYQNTVAGEVGRFEGYIAKFMGDGVLAYFGWPRAHEDEAERAVRAGLAIVAAVARLSGGGQALACRVGIATGLVVVGDLIGEGAAREQAVVGDTPNLAARLQAAAEPGAVVIGKLTRQLVGDLFALCSLEPQTFKGMRAPEPAHWVLRERALESRFAARRTSGAAPVVGRDQELALLLERWRQAKGGEGQLVLLTGEAGIGKSRITEAIIEAVAGEPHTLIRYQCSPYHAGSALHPAIHHLAHAADIDPDDDPERRLGRLEAWLARTDGPTATPEASALLAALLDLDATDRYGALTLTPQQRRARTLAALVDQLIGSAGRRPVMWVVEDAHWIDPTTLEMLELALERVHGSAVLVVVTARPTFGASFASHPVVTRLVLNRLARAAVQLIVDRISDGKRLPEAVLDEIAVRSDGVPLFVEEMTKSVLESGALLETADAYHLGGPLTGLAIPASLHDSLMARLDRLHPVREVAQAAAVIGRSFDHATIAALTELPEPALGDAMLRLVEAELVFRRGTPPDATYLFKHALVRDAAYESLLKAKRVAMHARLVDVLERSVNASPEVKAQHAEAGGLTERALGYWEQAGTRALARPAYREAIAQLENAVRLCREMGSDGRWRRREQGLHLKLGQALIANQGYQATATLRTFEHALGLADDMADVSLQLPALFGLWAGHHIAGTGSADLAQRYAALAETQSEAGPRLVGLRMLGLERFYEGRFAEALALTSRALEIYDPILHRDLAQRFGHDPRAAAANYKAWSLWHLGFPDQAASVIQDNLRWIREVDHANTTGLVLCFGTMTHIWLRQPDRVEAAAREALRLADEMTLPLWHAWASIHLGWALSQQGAASCLEEIEAGLREARGIGAGRFEPFHLGLAAEAYARAGRRDEAWERLVEALTALARGHHQAFAADLYRLRGVLSLHLAAGGVAAAEADLCQALAIAREQESPLLELRAATSLARLWADQGSHARARDLLAPVYGWFTEGFDTADIKEAKALLDELR